MLKPAHDGNLAWCKTYTLAEDDEAESIRVLRDGNLLLAGNTEFNVGTDPLVGGGRNRLVMKITPAGDLLWATAIPGRWGMKFRDSAEGPDGSLYAVGSHGDIVRDYYPSVLVAKFTPDGDLIHHVLIGEDPDWEDVLPDGGDTPYDVATAAVWRDGSLIVVGNTGLGAGASGWAASLTEELGVEWWSAFDGPGAATFEDLAATAEGFVAMGWIDDPWPNRFDRLTPAWLVNLPWEGLMRFHPSSNIRSSYLQPRVYLSSVQSDFIGREQDAYGQTLQVRTARVPFAISNSVPVAGAAIPAGEAIDFTTARLERLEPTMLSGYEQWAAYHQLTGPDALPDSDVESDGAKNLWEFFTGTDPLQNETNGAAGLAIQYDSATGTVEVAFPRAHAAASQPFNLQHSVNLQTWLPVEGTPEQVVGTTDLFDWVRLSFPIPDAGHAFFRLDLPTTP